MQNARRAHKIRLCGHLRRYKKIVKKTYIIYGKFFLLFWKHNLHTELIPFYPGADFPIHTKYQLFRN